MINFHGIKHKDKYIETSDGPDEKINKSSHFIILDKYFSEEKQKFFYDYFNEQQSKLNWYDNFEPLDISNKSYNILQKPYKPIKKFFDYIHDINILEYMSRFQVIRNRGIGAHSDGIENDFHGNSWTVYWFWFRLSQNKKLFFGWNEEVEFKNRCMIFNGQDVHSSPNRLNYDDYDKPEWSILIQGTPTQDFKDEFNLY